MPAGGTQAVDGLSRVGCWLVLFLVSDDGRRISVSRSRSTSSVAAVSVAVRVTPVLQVVLQLLWLLLGAVNGG